MKKEINKILDELIKRYPDLISIKGNIYDAFEIIKDCYESGNKLLIAGNGGSASDANHIVGELMKGFKKERKIDINFENKLREVDNSIADIIISKLQGALPAISLTEHSSLNTAYLNDVDGLFCIAQQVYGYGKEKDIFLAISTSGNSKNILYAAITAKAKGMKVIGLTGQTGGKLSTLSDILINVPECDAFKVQEFHLPIYHALCLMLEEYFY